MGRPRARLSQPDNQNEKSDRAGKNTPSPVLLGLIQSGDFCFQTHQHSTRKKPTKNNLILGVKKNLKMNFSDQALNDP